MVKKDNSLFAFVLMPFDSTYDDIYKLGIKAVAEELNFKAERVDEQIFREGILDRIYRQIEGADVVIADMSDQNPNVFYEVGYAHAKNKTCIHLTKTSSDIPFDLKHHRHIVYENSITSLKEKLKAELSWIKNDIEKIKTRNIKVTLKPVRGYLEIDKFDATGEVYYQIDLSNDSDIPSPTIEAIYIYTSSGWTFYQDDNKRPSKESDIEGFESRHLLLTPLNRFVKGSWAPLNLKSRKIIASVFAGDEILNEYTLKGRILLRLQTSEGNYDYHFEVEVVVDEIPF